MKCPFGLWEYYDEDAAARQKAPGCIGSDCAWWDGENGRCYIATLGINLERTAFELGNIRDRMRPRVKE